MRNTFEVLVNLYTKSGRKDKGILIEANKHDDKLLKLLYLSMDDYLVYGVSETSFEKILKKEEFFYKPDALDILFRNTDSYSETKYNHFVATLVPYLIEQQSPSNDVINELKSFFDDLNPIERYFYYRVLIKNLNIGLGPKTINQALGYLLIKQYTPMLADSGLEKFEKWKFVDKPNYLVDTKINGLRLTLFINVETKSIEIKTRSGRHFTYLEEYLKKNWLCREDILNHAKKNIEYQNALMDEQGVDAKGKLDKVLVVDCELQHRDKTWESSISIINVNEVEVYESPLEDEPLFYLHCFDIVNEVPFLPENFNIETPTLPAKFRRTALERFINDLPSCEASTIFKLSECYVTDDFGKLEELANKYISAGFEGAVVKHPESKYACIRNANWIKIKDIQTYDGTLIDVLPGEKSGKYGNMAGKIIVKATINGKEISGSCGTGFKEADRLMLMEHKEKLIGKTVEFSILSKTVNDNFQSGVFKCIRRDK